MDMQNPPETADFVAFALLLLILGDGRMRAINKPAGAELLDLYALCRAAVRGERKVTHGGGPRITDTIH